jgi:thiamine biosynthesis protein ThiS
MQRSQQASLAIHVNGDPLRVQPGASVSSLLAELGLAGRRVAVAVNREIVPRGTYDRRGLAEGDRVEILEAVGGGR